MKIKLSEIKDKLSEFEVINFEDIDITGISYDSRTTEVGDMFFPLEGENFNGHDFIEDAFASGAVVSLCDSAHVNNVIGYKKPIIVVDNIDEGLEKIVNLLFRDITAPMVAITGSTGKTTTREMLVTILKSKGSVLSTQSNINTLWGNAKLLSTYSNQDYIVLEVGMDRPGEIGWQCRAIEPDLGAILNIGYVHAANVGGIEGVFNAKKDLADYLHRTGKPLVLNADDEWLQKIEKSYTYQLLTYGELGKDNRLIESKVSRDGTTFRFENDGKEYHCTMSVYGKQLAYNALAAISLADLLGIDVDDSVKALVEYEGFGGRFEIKDVDGITVVNDAYNANPTSMSMSLETFNEIFPSNEYQRIVILGDMAELGDVSKQKHIELADRVSKLGFDKIYYVGEYYDSFNLGEKVSSWEDAKSIVSNMKQIDKPIAVLLKASHSVGLYQIVE